VLASRSRAAVARAPLLRVAVGNELLRWPPAARWLGSSAPVTLDTPFISDTIPLAEGILGNIDSLLKEVGDSVEEDEVVAVVETDKVSLDVRAGRAGVVTEVLVSVGEEVKETQPLYVLEPSD
jgi:biotin carboxyl carrier protein